MRVYTSMVFIYTYAYMVFYTMSAKERRLQRQMEFVRQSGKHARENKKCGRGEMFNRESGGFKFPSRKTCVI